VKVDQQPRQAGDAFRNGGSISRAGELLGWAPQVSLRDGVSAQLAWHRSRA
jgi:nucleoside-diphosphate-sugar epimerase